MFAAVVRHAERADSALELPPGSSAEAHDVGLSQHGRKVATEAGRELAAVAARQGAYINLVICSPYRRCVETGALMGRQCGSHVTLLLDKSLGESYNARHFDRRPGKLRVVAQSDALRFCLSLGVTCKERRSGRWPPWGESNHEARRRVASRFLQLLHHAAITGRNIVVVAHGEGVASCVDLLLLDGRCAEIPLLAGYVATVKNAGWKIAALRGVGIPDGGSVAKWEKKVQECAEEAALPLWLAHSLLMGSTDVATARVDALCHGYAFSVFSCSASSPSRESCPSSLSDATSDRTLRPPPFLRPPPNFRRRAEQRRKGGVTACKPNSDPPPRPSFQEDLIPMDADCETATRPSFSENQIPGDMCGEASSRSSFAPEHSESTSASWELEA